MRKDTGRYIKIQIRKHSKLNSNDTTDLWSPHFCGGAQNGAGRTAKSHRQTIEQESCREEEFLAKRATDGRLTIPKLTLKILERDKENSLAGAIFEVTITSQAT